MSGRLLVWEGWDGFRAEVARAELGPEGLRARGTQIGAEPEGYRLDYELETDAALVTRHVAVTVEASRWTRRLDLRRDDEGRWTSGAGEIAELAGADDCDLGYSPVFNTMPAVRADLLERRDAVDFLMAWISVPDLEVRPMEQRYEGVRPGVVRYSSPGFTADIEYDEQGFVTSYPQLGRRVFP